jgi:hypothetical protein
MLLAGRTSNCQTQHVQADVREIAGVAVPCQHQVLVTYVTSPMTPGPSPAVTLPYAVPQHRFNVEQLLCSCTTVPVVTQGDNSEQAAMPVLSKQASGMRLQGG